MSSVCGVHTLGDDDLAGRSGGRPERHEEDESQDREGPVDAHGEPPQRRRWVPIEFPII